MPALPNAPKIVKTALSGTMTGGAVWLSRFYTQYTGTAPTNADLHAFDLAANSNYATWMVPVSHPNTKNTQIESIDLSSSTSAIDTTANSAVGTRTGVELPAQVCVVTSYEIGRRYRGGHPRGYWPWGTSTDLQDDGNWSAAALTAFRAAIAGYYTAIAGNGWTGAGTLTHVNVSYYNGFTVVTDPITGRARNVPTVRVAPVIDTVTSVVTRASYGTQRRRVGFVG